MRGSEESNSDSEEEEVEEEEEDEADEGGEEEEEKDSFFCEDCDFTTTRKYHLNRHIESVHGDTRYSCDICEYQAKRKDNLKKHKQSIHGVYPEAQKKIKKKSKSSKKSRTSSPSPEPFYGFESPEKFMYNDKSTASLYEPFDKIIPEKNISGFTCKFCKYIYPKRKALIIHMQEAHVKNLTEEQKNLEVIFACTHCDKAFHSKFLQKVHIKAHRKIEASGGQCDNYYHYYHSAGVWLMTRGWGLIPFWGDIFKKSLLNIKLYYGPCGLKVSFMVTDTEFKDKMYSQLIG